MIVKLISIGNSRGIRIPRSVIRQCGFEDQVEMRVGDGIVTLAPARRLREGWESAFARMAATGGDELMIPDTLAGDWDREWEW